MLREVVGGLVTGEELSDSQALVPESSQIWTTAGESPSAACLAGDEGWKPSFMRRP
jgi:hypothetical protein